MCVKRTFVMAAWVALLAAAPVFGDVAGLVAALSGDNAEVRAQAFEGAGQYGPEAIGPVAALLDDENVAVVRAAKIALEKIAGPATDAARAPETVRRAASEALCNAAQSVKSKPGRDWLLWLLSYSGGPEAVPYLVGLMDSPGDFNMALLALQGIGGSEVTHALLGKLPGANVQRRVAIINALGAIGDADAVGPLIEEARWSGPAACAAIGALGRIGRIDAVDVLWPKIQPDPCTCAVNAYLQVADNQKRNVAAKLYKRLLSASDEP